MSANVHSKFIKNFLKLWFTLKFNLTSALLSLFNISFCCPKYGSQFQLILISPCILYQVIFPNSLDFLLNLIEFPSEPRFLSLCLHLNKLQHKFKIWFAKITSKRCRVNMMQKLHLKAAISHSMTNSIAIIANKRCIITQCL